MMTHGGCQPAFIGRRRELRLLADAWGSSGSAFIPIYGRRRVGKSELILRFLREHPGIYHLGKRAAAPLQIREFLHVAATALHEPLISSVPADNWKTALEAVVERWNPNEKLVLVMDEFQWTVDASPELPSILQELWDRKWSRKNQIVLILCGSYVGFMEREVLGRASPLFGRRTAQILLRAFNYLEAAEFHPSYSVEDRARTYLVCGGIPLYLKLFSPERSVEQNIVENLLFEYGPLHREPDFLLREELREVENYYAVLLAVARGYYTNGLISAQTGVGERSLHYYLKQLVELGYLAQIHPLTGSPPPARHVRYILQDPLLRFWFRFVFPNTSLLRQMGERKAFVEKIRPELAAYFGGCFESLCREALPFIYRMEGVTAAYEIGAYWDKSVQIDLVGLRDDGWTDLGECKWGRVHSAHTVLAELDQKVSRYPNRRNATIGRRVFSRQRISPEQRPGGSVSWHSIHDLYERRLLSE